MSSGVVSITLAVFVAALLTVATHCISLADARRAVEWPLLVAIAASLSLGTALERSGAAAAIARTLVDVTRTLGPTATLAAVYLATAVLTEIINHNAAAVLAFPLGLSAAALLGVSPRPFAMAVVLAASNAFASPVGYQTHMMVYGPGGYRFGDFVRTGVPLKLLLWALSVALIPAVWPF
jgi:di/tricarboxylate transporter